MCRIAIYGRVDDFRLVAKSLRFLERSQGGDGNGYFSFDTERIEKGYRYSTAEVAFETFDSTMPTLFHTRAASPGTQLTSTLNHPFDTGDYVLLHNGYWMDWRLHYRVGHELSDTECAARLVKEHGPGVLLDPTFSNTGVWIVADKNSQETLVIPRGTRAFKFQYLRGGGFFHASESLDALDVWHSYEAELHNVYSISPEGLVAKTNLKEVAMPKALREYKKTSYYNKTNGSSTYTGGYGNSWDYDDYYNQYGRYGKAAQNGNTANTYQDTGTIVVNGVTWSVKAWMKLSLAEREQIRKATKLRK